MSHVFQLDEITEVNCSHVNIRNENHGDDTVRAIDLAFYLEGSNDLLDMFDPDIRTTLYFNRDADAGQETIPGALAVLPHLRLIGLPDRMRWGGDDKHGGYRLELDYGLGKDNPVLTSCVVAKRWFEPKDGGSVKVGWRVSYAGDSLEDVALRGRLTGLTDQKAFIKLIAPPVLQVVKKEKKGKGEPANEPDATDIFAGKKDATGG